MVRVLGAGDEAAVEAFLSRHADSSMFLRANARAAGLVDQGAPLQGTYAGAFNGADLEALAAHGWNGMLLVQAPVRAAEVARAAVGASGRPLMGVSGPWLHALAAAEAVGFDGVATRDALYGLDLVDLRFELPPGLLARRPHPDELELLSGWRAEYLVETGLARAGPEVAGMAKSSVAFWHALGNDWVLERGGALVAYTGFNARLPGIVQVGGVWTPPRLRSQGLARAAVGTHLAWARAQGVERAVLFTPETNRPARRAYEALGFVPAGDYGLLVPR